MRAVSPFDHTPAIPSARIQSVEQSDLMGADARQHVLRAASSVKDVTLRLVQSVDGEDQFQQFAARARNSRFGRTT